MLRSPALEEAERWIASRPRGAPAPTEETQTFIADSRRGTTRRRNILTGSLAAGLVVALALAGLAYWQRGIAVEQRQTAEQQRKRAEDTLAAATKTANSLVFDLAQRFKYSAGVPAALIKDILEKARALQDQLLKSGQVTPQLRGSEAAALTETVEALLAIGDTQGALAAAEQARQIMADLVADSPTGTGWQDLLWVSQMKIGDVLRARGDLGSALASYRESLDVIDRLAKSNPSNADWQHDLSVSYEKIGYVQQAQGDLAGALRSFRDSLAIRERLARSDPRNAVWQRELSVSYDTSGNVQQAQGDLADALVAYRDSLAIRERLAKSNPRHAGWQLELSISYEEIGDGQKAQGDLAGALKSHRDSLAIRERLARSDPGNASWQRDLAASYDQDRRCAARRRRPRRRAHLVPARHLRHHRAAGANPIPATPAGSAICRRRRTTRSAMCCRRRVTTPARLHPIATASAIRESDWQNPIPATPAAQRDLSTSYNEIGGVLEAAG